MKKWWIYGLIVLFLVIGGWVLFTQQRPPIIKSATATLTILPAVDFDLVLEPADNQVLRPGDKYSINVRAISKNDFNGLVNLTHGDLPPGCIGAFFPNDTIALTPNAESTHTFEFDIPFDFVAAGDYVVEVTGTSTAYN